jgi:energy-coupling factor transporter ATP-binding protein EcfA2
MVRGKSFYAIWDEEKGLWSTDEYDVHRLVDNELMEERNRILGNTDGVIHVKFMSDFSTNAWSRYRTYLAQISDNAHQLDENLTFANTKVKKSDYVSRRLPYSLEAGKTEAYDKLMSTLYSPEERKKLEWAIGSIVAGEGKVIQKFIVLYGEGGSGKSTFLNILQKLFDGYYTTFEAKALTSASNLFSTEVFRNNPLVAIQHDGDLSRIEDNTKLNSIVAHEVMTMNEKYKPSYTARANCFLFMATNKPVRITDAKSGVIRRLIDVKPSGKKIPTNEYFSLMSRIDFELGAIAQKCLDIYRSMGKNYYSTYRPLGMILQTDVFFNFVETHYYTFLQQGGVSLTQAWAMYKEFCEESLIDFKLPRYKFRDELRNYFKDFLPVTRIDGKQVRSYYVDLITEKFKDKEKDIEESSPSWLSMDESTSIFDGIAKDYLAQYASEKYETPSKKWKDVKTTLKDLDTQKLHYVQVPEEHIVIDFDIRDSDGKKSPELNLKAATEFPPTYAEFSKSQCGIHLHYIYDGDVSTLSHVYSEGIEVKVFPGDSALRRKLSKCNSIPISTISGGLPTRPKKMINFDVVQSEKGIRELIKRNLRKEIHPGTKPSIDFIYKILEDAYESDLHYDVRDMRPTILAFAMNSTNQSKYCVKVVSKMHFHSEEPSIDVASYPDDRLAFFDVEVFPNLFLVNWKYEGEDNECIHMINPTPQDVEELLKLRLIGFNCRRYDNHILYARYIGYDNEMIYNLSKKIIEGYRRILFGEAYNVSYADVYDFSSKKQSLKKFQIELGIHHLELGFPFDEPIPEEKWPLVIEYCDNDVISTEAVFHARKQDFVARQILAAISGLTVNDSTQSHAAKIIFGDNRAPQDEFVYTDLSEEFAGYEFNFGKSSYRDEDPGEGGYVYAEPGYYEDVALLDIASMHPTSILTLNLFGSYTEKYRKLVESRLAIKHKDFDTVIKNFGGVFEQFVTSVDDADDLAYALKIVINIVYGLTSAKFSNPFRDNRNVDNIVAKRGALFMIDLKHAVQEQGYTVAHIKTDSIKIPKATKKIIDFVVKFGKKYGYDFEHETTFEKFCLVNDAVYIGRKLDGTWTATGAEFQHPYIFKSLFSKEPIVFEDMCETKTVTTALYLDMNETLPEDEHAYMFIGRAGSFCPIKPGANGGILLREKEGKYYAASGTKGWRWLQSAMVKELKKEEDIDLEYFRLLVDKAVDHIREFVDFEVLTS